MNKITYDFRAFNKIKYKKKYLIKFDKIIINYSIKQLKIIDTF